VPVCGLQAARVTRSNNVEDLEHPATGDLDRLVFLSDGVFAIAMTLLVVQFTVPVVAPTTPGALGQHLRSLGPLYFSYTLSFLVIASYWSAHRRVFRHIVRVDTGLVWLNLVLLLLIAFQPFPTSVLGNYGSDPAAVTFYALTLTLTGIVVLGLWVYAVRDRRLVRPDLDRSLVEEHMLRALMIPVVFAISIAIAQVNAGAAEYWWIVGALLTGALRGIYRRRTARGSRPRK
jgi:uncharacterized membrane protein